MSGDTEETMRLLEEMAIANASKNDVLKIKYLLLEYNKGFQLIKKEEFSKAKSVFRRADAIMYHHFKENSFEFYFSQLFAISSKSYLEFKMKKKDQAIVLTKKGIAYAILLQECESSHDMMGLFISQMLQNLAKIHLLSKEIKDWHDITLENIHFLLNFSIPKNCKGFDMERFKKVPDHLRYSKIIAVLNEALSSITKFKVTNGYKWIELIIINDNLGNAPIITSINSWVKLNRYIGKQQTDTDEFNTMYTRFIESKHSEYDLGVLKQLLKNRIKEEGVKLYEMA